MDQFYEDFYTAVDTSPAHAEFCTRVFGRNLAQHGFADLAQLDALLDAAGLGPADHALDLGCGNGLITAYLADQSGACFTGLDNSATAIRQAQDRTRGKADRLAFRVGDLNALDLPAAAFDAIVSIDSLYFAADLPRTIGELARALRPGGQMLIYYAHGREPWVPKEEFRAGSILPDGTPLAQALQANGLHYAARNFTADDDRLARLRIAVLAELRPRFEAEGLMFIWESRNGDAHGIRQAIEDGLHARYLYHVRLSGDRS